MAILAGKIISTSTQTDLPLTVLPQHCFVQQLQQGGTHPVPPPTPVGTFELAKLTVSNQIGLLECDSLVSHSRGHMT